ncbi:imelysin family protein [Ruixingdingia sedimenti]|uniref:Imelysin family protein n=1 Tax=Ruixingdingia sedimenti TaxID=3073604 RepID=A0ABU1F6M1_9RHOB|nr:imelysin family protein [Xinfangfangia sp. LG-4]MDR5652525.1 imelysin family protein [Xinfangfangia sp. LG-4]
MLRVLLLSLLLAAPARADVAEVVDTHVLPGYDAFATATAALDRAAQGGCDADVLRPAYHAAFDAWMGVQHLHLGPAEEAGRALAIAFWPDPKGLGWRAQRALLAGDPAALAPGAFADQSVAARGLTGLERLLWPATALPADPCPLIRATAADLARMAAEIRAGWDGFAAALLEPGGPGNSRYLTQAEARQALLTQLVTGLEHLADQRLGRPLGTFERPFPDRAEARAAGRSLRNVTLALRALRGMAMALAAPAEAPQTRAALDRAVALAEGLDDPVFAGVADPQGRLKVEILQQATRAARAAALAEIAPRLGVGLGFNALDGD